MDDTLEKPDERDPVAEDDRNDGSVDGQQDRAQGATADLDSIPHWTELYTKSELEAAIRVFTLYADNTEYKKHAQANPDVAHLFKTARRALIATDDEIKDRRRRRKKERKDADLSTLAVTGIRQMRKVKMVGYSGGSVDIPMPPRIATKEANEEFAAKDDERLKGAVPSIEDSDPHSSASSSVPCDRPRLLNYNRACHVCGVPFRQLHHFYDQMCPSCAEHNFSKRYSTADMRDRVCIVTGARVKIGYCIALKLLRMGATVIVTTRFPHDAAGRYAKEEDFLTFKGRLAVYGLDFRDIPMLHHFCNHVKQTYQRLDVIINNAAQTVRKPPAFYEHLIGGESQEVSKDVLEVIDLVDVFRLRNGGGYLFAHGGGRALAQARVEELSDGGSALALAASQATAHLPQINTSAQLSQLPIVPGDEGGTAKEMVFPPGLYDRDDQQLDLRSENSWTQELGQISTAEMMECHVINAFAPWVLVSELKALMEATKNRDGSDGEWDKFIVNVSAMEGQFYRSKTIFHPHSNMAKAALNMMTRTSSAGLAAVNIYMTAVDTGWITDENPVEQWSKRENAPPPLDEWDGM
ncbi:hypothetical protein HK104_006921 [Borealophlyctis nickersoniae]|nr:hypothetical protein HK104_006921 [Borealophlyctis nickersoniae]